MNDEIESLYAMLGIKPDEASVNDSVNKLIKDIQSKLKSSIYGGKNGVITLPATIEGKFKNGKEINQDIKDAYVAIYNKAKQMADESVSLTLKDIKDFKAQIDKFSKKTAKYKGSDIIANANNNLRQTLSDYQDFVNDLRKQVSAQQKTQIKQTQKTKAQQNAKTQQKNKTAYDDYLDKQEEYSQQARDAKKQKELFNELDEVKKNKSIGSLGNRVITGVTTEKTLKMSDRSGPYPSNYARQMKLSELAAIKWMKKSLKAFLSENIADDYAKAFTNGMPIQRQIIDKKKNGQVDVRYEDDMYYGQKKMPLTEQQKADEIANSISNELAKILGGLESNRPDASIDQFNKYLEATLQSEKNGKGGYDAILLALNKTFHRYFNTDGTLGITDGSETGVGEGYRQAQKAITGMIKTFKKKLETDFADKVVKVGKQLVNVSAEELRQLKISAKIDPRGAEKELNRILNGTNVSSTKRGSNNKLEQEVDELTTETKNTTNAVKTGTKETRTQTTYDKLDNVKKDVDEAKHIKVDEVNRDINKDVAKSVKADEATGFNTNEKADAVIDLLRQILSAISGRKSDLLTLPPAQEMKKVQETAREAFKNALKSGASYEEAQQRAANVSNKNKAKNTEPNGPVTNGPVPPKGLIGNVPPYRNKVEKSNIYASPVKTTVWDKLEDAFNRLTGATREYNKVINANADEQDRMAAERIKTWGMNNGRNPNDTGDIAGMRRILQLYRTNKSSIEQNPELKQRIRLTEGREVDTTKITRSLAKALSGKQMRNAQMGGSIPRQILGAFTGFVGMPSVEKSRAQADGLNQTLGNINKALQSVLSSIQTKETELAGMEKIGEVQFDDEGYVTKGSSAAYKTLADLEEYKVVLDSILADMNMVDRVVGQTNGKFSKLVKRLSFTSPVLRENNSILRNINAGLDKNGKALKYQTRIAEILNYTFQLISRSIGQWFKKLLSMLNPFNILKNTIRTIVGWVKSAFQDFGSYDVKWQRTMNVIKINFQRAIKPAMEWIAQKLVNIIGFFNIISMKVQEAFGQVPVDLFDQAGANAEKMRRELEQAANVSAGFDELHDIGSDNSGANDLLGDIYKPQLSKEWEDLANRIGDLFAGLIKGDLGFGDVAKEILKIVGELLGKIAKKIWDWFKETKIGKWITEHWKGLLATLLAIFLAWKLLKIAGTALFNALFGKLLEGSIIKGIFSKLGGWISSGLSALAGKGGILGFVGSFGQGVLTAIQWLFADGKYSLIGTLKEMFTNKVAITQAGSWGSMIGFAFTKGLLAVLAGYATYKITDFFGDKAVDNENYNLGLMTHGGKEEDKKSNAGNILGGVLTGIGGGAVTGAIIGGVPGAVIGGIIGGIAGTLQTVLKPALEETQIAARNMNNELQNINYYEGATKGAQTQVNELDTLMNVLNETLQKQTEKVYAEGEELGITRTRMDELVEAVQDGTYHTGMLNENEMVLAGSLEQLSYQQEKNKATSDKLTEAKKKLAKAEMDLAIAQDIEAGNYELAAARIELALASEVYDTTEATKKMIQLTKEADEGMRANLLADMSPDMKKNWEKYVTTTEQGKRDLATIYSQMNEEERDAFSKSYEGEAGSAMKKAIDAMQNEINSASWDWSHPFKSLMSTFSGNWSWKAEYASYDVGTNYVPNDGFAYIHKGEAIIPADQNVFAGQGEAFNAQLSSNTQLLNAIITLNSQLTQGIKVNGEFRQRGSDLVAVVNKTNSQTGANIISDASYAR